MAGERSRKIVTNVAMELYGKTATPMQRNRIYNALNRIQQEICERGGAKQVTATISIVAGTELYDVPDGFVGDLAMRTNSTTPIVRIDITQLSEIKRRGYAVTVNSANQYPTYFYKWNNQYGFVDTAGNAPSAATTVTLYGIRGTAEDGSEDISGTVDPIIDRGWDTCLFYGCLAEMSDNQKWENKYERELQRQIASQNSQQERVQFVRKDSTIIE